MVTSSHSIETKKSVSTFLNEDFLLTNEFAKKLYHNHAAHLPIIDYHCHLSPQYIAENKIFNQITEAWLDGDHYKWRAMRTLGIDEKYITGDAEPHQKFQQWAKTVPYTVRNPLYHWSHLELKRYFGIDMLLTANTADEIYTETSRQLKSESYGAFGLLKKMNVETVCSTDDPIDSLEYHDLAKSKDLHPNLLPAFRPDKAYAVENTKTYIVYLEKLGEASNINIHKYDDLLDALKNRVNYFHSKGGRLSDHGLEQLYYFEENTFDINQIFRRITRREELSIPEIQFFKFKTLLHLSKMYHALGWTQQYHLGALRNTNTRMLSTLGPDTGYDSIGDFPQAQALGAYLNKLDSTDQLAKTILYNLNPADNEVMATMIGNFNDGSVKGKIQFGSGWWFLDQKDGIEKQLNALSNLNLLSCFVGMLTDSRSFLSFPRHEYFRRVLCNLIGQDVANGELPADEVWLGKIVSDICYHNAKEYFKF